jgi:hypothetical protein
VLFRKSPKTVRKEGKQDKKIENMKRKNKLNNKEGSGNWVYVYEIYIHSFGKNKIYEIFFVQNTEKI